MVPRDVAVAIATITYCVEYQSKCYKEQEPLVAFINLMFLFLNKVWLVSLFTVCVSA